MHVCIPKLVVDQKCENVTIYNFASPEVLKLFNAIKYLKCAFRKLGAIALPCKEQ